jgi:biotin transport system substrate-specific component
MSELEQLTKPHPDITDYEWERTPISVKILFEDLESNLKQRKKQVEELKTENVWCRKQLNLQIANSSKPNQPSAPEVILWTAIGTIITTCGTFIPAYGINPPWAWTSQGIQMQTLNVTYQIGAVLLAACLGGKNAGFLSQIIYVAIGLTLLPIFDRGGGWDYIKEPSFGYILGFVIAAWLCGWLAFQSKAKLNSLSISCFIGFLTIHLVGIAYLFILGAIAGGNLGMSTLQAILTYSVYPLPSQIMVVCPAILIAFGLRKFMFN